MSRFSNLFDKFRTASSAKRDDEIVADAGRWVVAGLGNPGVRSVATALGTAEFIRVRIGVGHPGESAGAVDHVLKPLTSAEAGELEKILDRVADAVASIIREGLERAMGIYNQRV